MPVAVAVVVVAAVVATSVTKFAAAEKAAKLEKRRLKIQKRQRELENRREVARLRRQERIQRAQLLNRAAVQGSQFSSATEGALQGISTRTGGEIGFLDQTLKNAEKADKVTKKQINLNKTLTQVTAITEGIGGSGKAISGVV